ncbi:hypothetical protein AB0L70_16290 [Kribbella sp. NPDC051952]|uniref:hypothetical protein n=1 Tax=Kribbella sp. NPDC051952 TaxID=3154851 RepID=UPI00341335A2
MAGTNSRRKKRIIITLLAVLSLTGAGVAFAYWTSTGTGSGAASTGTSTALTITSEDAVGTIAPGNAGQTVGFTVTNPGPGVQSLTNVTVTMAGPTGTAWVPPTGCLIADYTAAVTTAPVAGAIPVGESRTGTATVTLANTGLNQDACKNAAVPLYFVAS